MGTYYVVSTDINVIPFLYKRGSPICSNQNPTALTTRGNILQSRMVLTVVMYAGRRSVLQLLNALIRYTHFAFYCCKVPFLVELAGNINSKTTHT